MTFPQLPDGYVWRVDSLIPTSDTASEQQVMIRIVRNTWWARFANDFALFMGSPTAEITYSTQVRHATDSSVRSAAELLYLQFMAQRKLPARAARWESELNAGS